MFLNRRTLRRIRKREAHRLRFHDLAAGLQHRSRTTCQALRSLGAFISSPSSDQPGVSRQFAAASDRPDALPAQHPISNHQTICVSSSSRIPPQSVGYTLTTCSIVRGHLTAAFPPRARQSLRQVQIRDRGSSAKPSTSLACGKRRLACDSAPYCREPLYLALKALLASRLWWYSTQAYTIPYKSSKASSILTRFLSSLRFLSPLATYLQSSKSFW